MPLLQPANSKPRRRWPTVAALFLTGAFLATCATPTPYQPVLDSNYGYADRQIESGRYQISFSGNSLTDRQTVEDYLLFRAAELTIQDGKDYFVVAERDTEQKTTYRATYSYYPYGYFPYSFYYHSYPYYSRFGRYGYRGGFYNDYYSRPITRYTATADIVTYAGEKPSDNPRAYDAREVMTNLGPNIVRPEDLQQG